MLKPVVQMFAIGAALSMVLLSSASASADPYDSDYHAHTGFFLRMNVGPGFSYVEATDSDASVSGFGLALNLSIGGAVAKNLIIHGDLYTTTAFDPDVDVDGGIDGQVDGMMYNSGLGVGLTYYLPSNFFLTFGAGLASQSFVYDDDDIESDAEYGIGTRFMFGKEWWVSSDWGIGLAAQVSYAFILPDNSGDDSMKIHALTTSVLFSATYN
ncbi:MAG: hypothetical protein H6714_03275 [Myxococcales bacterium]|nr:hypothetical protein [Myxococcales bacterium]